MSTVTHVTVRSVITLALPMLLLACGPGSPSQSSQAAATDSTDTGTASVEPSQPGVAASQAPLETAGPRTAVLTPDGWGPLRIGMTRAEVVRAAAEDAQPDAVGGPDPAACDEFRPREAPEGLRAMIEDGILTRITVSRNSDISTAAGIRVGDPAAAVLARYGAEARVEPHKYWEPPARYVTVWRTGPPEADRRGIRFEIDPDDQVVHMHAGGPSIEYVEGCL